MPVYPLGRACCFFGALSLLMLSLAVGNSASAQDITAVWVPGSGDQAVFSITEPDRAQSDEALLVGRAFYDFCSSWIGNKNGYALQNMRVHAAGDCFVKEYSLCANAHELSITKKTGSPVYVGVLKYVEQVYRSSAGPAVQAGAEAFVLAAEVPVTEIFMYIDGQWRY